MKSQVLHTVWCNINGEAAGKFEVDHSVLGAKGLKNTTRRQTATHHAHLTEGGGVGRRTRGVVIGLLDCWLLGAVRASGWLLAPQRASCGTYLLSNSSTPFFSHLLFPPALLLLPLFPVINRVVKCHVIISQIFTFKTPNHIIQYTQKLQECVQKFRSPALCKSNDRAIQSSVQPHTKLSYLALVPNEMNQH